MNDGIKVIYLSEENKYYDNLQAEEIVEAIATEIWNPLLEKMEPYDFREPGEVKVAVNKNLVDESDESFFHEYYEGDIKSFLEKERPWFDIESYKWDIEQWSSTELCLISETDMDWQNRVEILNNVFEKYFREENYIFNIVALTQELFDIVRQENMFIDIGVEDCWAMGAIYELKEQKFIEMAEGIYVTWGEPGFCLEEGDIRLKESEYSIDEIQGMMDERVKEELEESGKAVKYTINSITPIYEMEFSERVKEKFEGNSVLLYIKYVSSEADLAEGSALYIHPYSKSAYMGVSYEVVAADSRDAESQIISINKKDKREFFWIGTENREEIY